MAWNDLELSDKARMIQLAVKSGITDLRTIQDVYNTFGGGGFKDRVRENDSPTKEATEAVENDIHRRQMLRNTASDDYFIPYIEEKEIKVPGVGRVSTNMLDSLAKYSLMAGVPVEEGIGLAIEETKLGSIPNWSLDAVVKSQEKSLGRELTSEEKKALERKALNASVARNFGGIYPQFLINDHDWDDRGWEKSNKYKNILEDIESPLEHGYTLYKMGLYNAGMPNHTQRVKDAGRRAFKTEPIQNWWSTSEFNPKNKK